MCRNIYMRVSVAAPEPMPFIQAAHTQIHVLTVARKYFTECVWINDSWRA